MERELKKRLPKFMDWKWRLLTLDQSDDMKIFYALMEEQDISIDLEDLGYIEYLKESIYDVKPIRRIVHELLLEGAATSTVVRVINMKFGSDFSEHDINTYRDYFFDTKSFTKYQLAKILGDDMPERPPVPDDLRHDYAVYKNGGIPDLDMEVVLKDMFVGNYFRAKELSKYGMAADDKIMRLQKQALDIYSKIKVDDGDSYIPENFKYVVEYPDSASVATSVEEIGEYNKDEDPNEEKK